MAVFCQFAMRSFNWFIHIFYLFSYKLAIGYPCNKVSIVLHKHTALGVTRTNVLLHLCISKCIKVSEVSHTVCESPAMCYFAIGCGYV